MTKNTTDLREQIAELANACQSNECGGCREQLDDFMRLISNREKLARIDEWEKFIALESGENGRLATLRKELDGGQK